MPTLKYSSRMLISAVALAAVTSVVAGLTAIGSSKYSPDAGPRNHASLSSSVGKDRAVTITLAGGVDQLDEDQFVRVKLISKGVDRPLASLTVHPDADGKVKLESVAHAPIASTSMTAAIVVKDATGSVASYKLSTTYPAVPKPQPGQQAKPAS